MKMTLNKRNILKAFTLIELLVVIAIISILAAILFPVFAQAREKARQTSCLSNQKQIGVAFLMYMNDFDEQMPLATHGDGGAGRELGWMYYSHYPANDPTFAGKSFDATKGSLYSYIKNTQIFTCPSDDQGSRTGNSYAANSCAFKTTSTEGVLEGKTMSDFDAVSDWLLLSEEAFDSSSTGSDASFLRTGSTDDGSLYYPVNLISTRHALGSNCVFVDGHAKWFRAEQIISNHYQTGGKDSAACP